MNDEIPKLPTIWAVARGEYSDYRVLAVTDDKDRAHRAVAILNAESRSSYDAPFVEEIIWLDRDPVMRVWTRCMVTIWDDDRVTDESTHQDAENEMTTYHDNVPMRWRWVRAPMHNNKGGRLEVAGFDERLVKKVFSERKAMLLANPAMRQLGQETGDE